MSGSEKLSYLEPRSPSIKCWNDRVKLAFPLTENIVKLGLDVCEEATNEKLKVYLRIKPCKVDYNPYSIFNNTLEAEAPSDNGGCKKISRNVGKLINKFQFTTIFRPESTQENVFEKCVLPNLKKFIGGSNDLLFAYGTTNAGKTFTMQGTVENPGMIPRAIQFIFRCLGGNIENMSPYQPSRYNELCLLDDEELRRANFHKNFILSLNLSKYQRNPELSWRSYKTKIPMSNSEYSSAYENDTFREIEKNLENLDYEVEDDSYSVWISMIEIYNEDIYDLLEVPSEREARVKPGFAEDENGKVYIKNVRYIQVSNGHEAFQIFEFGRANLRLGPTALNYWSSRSHCICTLTLGRFSKNKSSSSVTMSRFSFCDLAGAERVKKALAEGTRLVESKSINTSLSVFAKCLSAIRENQTNGRKRVIPYRESKLTRLFRDAMMGQETFSIIVNVTPESHLFCETLNVLKFSAVARQIVPVNIAPRQKRIKLLGRSKVTNVLSNSERIYKIDWENDEEAVKEKNRIEDKKKGIEIENLLTLIENLKIQVAEERERASIIEREVRKEYETKLMRLMNNFEKQKDLFINENKRIRGWCDRENQRLVKRYEERERRLKRMRLEEDYPNYIEIETLSKDLEFLKLENASLKDLVQQINANSNILQKKYSEMQFELSEKDRMLNIYKRSVEHSESGEVVKEREKQLLQTTSKNKELKELLDENEFDYKDLLLTNTLIKEENVRLLSDLATTSGVVGDLERELRECEKMLSAKTKHIEELESRINETNNDIFIESDNWNDKVYDIVDLEESDGNISNVGEEGETEKLTDKELYSDDSQFVEVLNVSENKNPENEDRTVKKSDFKRENELSTSETRPPKGEMTFSWIDGNGDEENLLDYESLVKLVDQLKEEVAEQKDRADNVESTVRKELETKFADIIELKILQERDLFESEKKLMKEDFEHEKLRLTEYYEEKIKNLSKKSNDQDETIKSLNEDLKRLAPDMDQVRKEGELKYEELTNKNLALMEELDRYNKEKINFEEVRGEKKCDCEKDKRSNFTFLNNLIKKFEAAGMPSVTREVEDLKEEDIADMLEEKILKLLEEGQMNRREINSLRSEHNELKKKITFNFRSFEYPSHGGGDETMRLEELMKSGEGERYESNGNEILSENRHEQKECVAVSVSELLSLSDSNGESKCSESTPNRLSREIEKLSIFKSETKKSCKKTESVLEKSIHPSLLKRCAKSKRKGKKQGETTEAEVNEEESKDCKKDDSSNKNKGKKCNKKLFVENDFDDMGNLDSSFTEPEIPRLRPRKK